MLAASAALPFAAWRPPVRRGWIREWRRGDRQRRPGPDRTNRRKLPPPPSKHAHGRWLRGVTITEYWPAPESWFVGRRSRRPASPASTGSTGCTRPPGSPCRARASASTAGSTTSTRWGRGLGHRRRAPHLPVERLAERLAVLARRRLLAQPPQGVTFPLAAGGWSAGRGRRYVPLRDVSSPRGHRCRCATTSRSPWTRA